MLKKTFQHCREANVKTVASLIVPAPGEDKQSQEETLQLIKDIRPDSTFALYPGLIPDTQWDRESAAFGFDIDDKPSLWRKGMTYAIDAYLPPVFWPPVNEYRVNGLNVNELLAETAAFLRKIRKEGLATHVWDAFFLLTDAIGTAPGEFQDDFSRLLRTGGEQGMLDSIKEINEALASPPP